ncbi:MAG: ATP-binding protein [Pseudomonadota bacterium]
MSKNAIEASPPNQRVKVIVKDDEDWLHVRIHNWGTVPNELINTFFEKYSTAGKKKGIGLGTYLARLVINAHHGEIGVISIEDEGTTITIRLPLPLDKTETHGMCAMHQIGVSAPS